MRQISSSLRQLGSHPFKWGFVWLLILAVVGAVAYAIPGVAGAPTFSGITSTSVVVKAPNLPSSSTSLRLQRKLTSATDSTYIILFSNIAAGASNTVSGLTVGTGYTFRFQAVDASNASTSGTAANVTTKPQPSAPAAPTLSSITATAITAKAPATLPANAISLTLQKKLTADPDTSYANVKTDVTAGQSNTASGLTAGTAHSFRFQAVSGTASTNGAAASATTLSLPGAPGAPVYSSISVTTLTVQAPVLPANSTSLTLQRKLASEADTNYSNVAAGLAGNSTRSVTGLTAATDYTFRFQAVGTGGTTSGTAANVTTKSLPSAPPAPTLSSVTATSVVATAPTTLPTNADTLTLQKKLAAEPDTSYANVKTGVTAGQANTASGLTETTAYSFRFQAVSGTASTNGATASATTLSLPGAPGVPTYSYVGKTTLTVQAPVLPASSTSLTLQRKLASGADTTYSNVATGLAGSSTRNVTGLTAATAYTFRFQAVGTGGTTSGVGANVSTFNKLPNDDFADAMVITPNAGILNSTNIGATAEVGEPDHWNAAKYSLWYRWTAPANTPYQFSINPVSANNIDPTVEIYTGNTISTLTKIYKYNYGNYYGSQARFDAISGTTYYIAVDSVGSSTGNFTLTWNEYLVEPDAPQNLKVLPANSQTTVSWDATPRAASYILSRKSSVDPLYSQIVTVNAPTNSYLNSGLTNGVTYYYKVQALNATGYGPSSDERGGTPNIGFVSPGNLMVSGTLANGTLTSNLTWDVGAGNTSHKVYRRMGDTSYGAPVATLSQGTSSWTDAGLATGPVYYYVVTGMSATSQESIPSNEVSIGTTPPSAPSGVNAKPGDNQIILTWNPVIGATRYSISRYRYTTGTSFTSAGSFSSLTARLLDTTAVNGSKYFYFVYAVNPAGTSSSYARSNDATPQPPAATPIGVTAVASGAQITLNWSSSANASYYQVKRSNRPGGPYVLISQSFSATNYVDTAVVSDTAYYYVVEAGNSTGWSEPSSEVSATIAPSVVKFSDIGSTKLNAHLPQLPGNAQSFTLYRAAQGNSTAAPTTSNRLAWFRADSITGVESGSSISAWSDLSGNGNLAAPASTDRAPTFVKDAFNGRSALRFDGVNDGLNLSPGFSDFSSGLTAFVLAKPSMSDDTPKVLFELFNRNRSRNNSEGIAFYLRDDSGDYRYGLAQPNGGDIAGSGVAARRFQILSVTHAINGDTTLFRDGISVANGNLPLPVNLLRKNGGLGHRSIADDEGDVNYDHFFGGDIAEVLIYNRALTSAERTQTEDYLNGRYGTPTSVPTLTWIPIATGLASGATYVDNGLNANTTYWYKAEAVGPPNTMGLPSSVTTSEVAPAVPNAPAFTNVRSTAVTVTPSPAIWPSGTKNLKLQQKLASAPATIYVDIATLTNNGAAPASIEARSLATQTKYSFRYVALSDGAATVGPESTVTTASSTNGGSGGLLGVYYFNKDFTKSAFERLDSQVNFDWRALAPRADMGTEFSVRWMGQIQPEFTESYTFRTFSRLNQARVWINGTKIIDGGDPQASAPIALIAGQKYNLQIDFVDTEFTINGSDEANLIFQWESPSRPLQVVPSERLFAPTGDGTGLRAQYFNDRSFGTQVFSRTDLQIANSWVTGQVDPRLNPQRFATWWTGQIKPQFSETYTFTSISNEGMRVWVNNQLVIDSWSMGGNRSLSGTISLTAEQLTNVKVAYYGAQESPVAQLLWSSATQAPGAIPRHRLYPAAADSSPPNPPEVEYDARFVSVSAPRSVLPGRVIPVTLKFKNSGTQAWHSVGIQLRGFLRAPGTTTAYAAYQFPLPYAKVNAGDTVTFDLSLTAPTVKGNYGFFWNMEIIGSPNYNWSDRAAFEVEVESMPQPPTVVETISDMVRLKMPPLPGYALNYTLQRAVGGSVTQSSALPTANRAVWFKADDLFLDEGAPVSDWSNAAGTGHAFQSEAWARPFYSANGPGGRPIVRFNNRTGLQTDINGPGGTGVTFFVVAKAPTKESYSSIAWYVKANGSDRVSYPDARRAYWGSRLSISNDDDGPYAYSGLLENEWNIGTARWSSGALNGLATWRNGTLVGSRNANTSTLPSSPLSLGSYGRISETFDMPFEGDLAEVLIYHRALSDAERITVETYLAHKYAQSSNLAAPDEGDWVTIATNLTGDALYEDTGLNPNTVYRYRVIAQTGTEGLKSPPTLAATRAPVGAAPDAPGAPVSGTATVNSITVTAPGPDLPARTSYLKLQVKFPEQADGEYADLSGRIGPAQTKVAAALQGNTTYRFRFVAVGPGGSTPSGLSADYTTLPAPPEAPGAPQFGDVTATGLTVEMPALPARATSLTLEFKDTYSDDPFVGVPSGNVPNGTPKATPTSTGLEGYALVQIIGLTPGTNYTFRAVAVGPGGATAGGGGSIAAGGNAPSMPREPQFRAVTSRSVEVIAPPLPDNATSLLLQGRLNQDDSSWNDIVGTLGAGAITPVDSLSTGQTYLFRYLAYGAGGWTPGLSASVTLFQPLVVWRAGSALESQGIRFPDSTAILQAGQVRRFSAFVGVDWDARDTYEGSASRTERYTDACTYVWSCSAQVYNAGGGFLQGNARVATIKSQNPRFIVPSSGLYANGLILLVDDQGGLNKALGEGGARDDAAVGFNDDALKFMKSLSVLP